MAVNRKQVIESMSRIQVEGNSEGLIPAFNVLVNQMPADFWNSFAERLTRQVDPSLIEAAEYLLVNAAHECGYSTGYGIITSEEWKAVVGPMVEKEPEDILRGAFAVLAALGWANSWIEKLEPGESMLVRASDYYEADVVRYGSTAKHSAYMLRGVCAAFMDLAYGGPYDESSRAGLRTFQCQQTKGLECGDEYGEFVVTRAAA